MPLRAIDLNAIPIPAGEVLQTGRGRGQLDSGAAIELSEARASVPNPKFAHTVLQARLRTSDSKGH